MRIAWGGAVHQVGRAVGEANVVAGQRELQGDPVAHEAPAHDRDAPTSPGFMLASHLTLMS